MKKILILLVMLSGLYSITINIPDDYPTIQEGIDVAVDGDTVLVADGDYLENLVISKSIVLASHAIFEDLTNWVIIDDDNQPILNNVHIENTEIFGNNPENPNYASVILIAPEDDTCINPEIMGFTITEGNGTRVTTFDKCGNPIIYDGGPNRLGGGILSDVADPFIHHNYFLNNGSSGNDPVLMGGAARLTSSSEDWSFNDRFENVNPRCDIQEFRISDNFFIGNRAVKGNDFGNRFFKNTINLSNSIFEELDNDENTVHSEWIWADSDANINIYGAQAESYSDLLENIYVDSSIGQECLGEGCGSENNPYKTITTALSQISPSSTTLITVHLAEGVYSPETGEIFPINMIPFIHLKGQGSHYEGGTVIDAMGTNEIMGLIDIPEAIISNMLFTGGSDNWDDVGGIILWNSDPFLTNLVIYNNGNADSYVGGIALWFCSSPIIQDVIFMYNEGIYAGALSIVTGVPEINNCIFYGNKSNIGGAINFGGGETVIDGEEAIIRNSLFYYNRPIDPVIADLNGASTIAMRESSPTIVNSIFWNNHYDYSIGEFHEYADDEPSFPIIAYNDFEIHQDQEGWGIGIDLGGNINESPEFIDAGFYFEDCILYNDCEDIEEATGFEFDGGSPCIDAGTAYLEVDGEVILDIHPSQYDGYAPDMGPFEYIPDCHNSDLGDLNFDNDQDIADIIILVDIIMGFIDSTLGMQCRADMNQDGIIDIFDVIIIINIILNQ